MKELGLIKDNGEDINSPNYKYVVAWFIELGHKLGHHVQVKNKKTTVYEVLGQSINDNVPEITGLDLMMILDSKIITKK